MNPPKMPIHIGDFLRDTGHLRAAGIGAYALLMFHHWSTGSLPDDDEQLMAISRLTKAEWSKLRPILSKFFDDGWHHGRIAKDLATAHANYEKRAKAGSEGGKAKAAAKQSSSKTVAMLETESSNALATDNRLPDTKEERSSLRSEARAARATRLPDDWIPSEIDLAFAVERGLSIAQIETEALKFRNHWTSKSGKDATKTNWLRTWENWILNVRGAPNHGNRTGNPRASGHDAILAVASRKARELDRNDEMAGPAGAPGFAFGDGAQPATSNGSRGEAEADRGDCRRHEPDEQRVREGEIIPPDQDAAGLSGRRQFV